MRPSSSEDTFYEIVRRDTRANRDLQVLPKAVKGKRAAQAAVERLQSAIAKTGGGNDHIKWTFRVSTR